MSRLRTAGTVTAAAAAAVALAGGLGAASANASGSGAGSGGSGAKTGACQPGTLQATATDAGESQHGMNHAGTFLRVENTGKTACSFSGYPGLALEGAGHTAIKTKQQYGDTYFAKDPGKRKVTLKPGGVAWANLEWTHSGASMKEAKHLQVSPTGSNAHSTVAFDQGVDNGALSVTAWSPKRPTP